MRTNAKIKFEKYFYKLMNNANFGKTMENIRKNHDIKLVTIEKRTNYLVSEPNCKSTKWFSEKLLEIEMAETKVTMCKLV